MQTCIPIFINQSQVVWFLVDFLKMKKLFWGFLAGNNISSEDTVLHRPKESDSSESCSPQSQTCSDVKKYRYCLLDSAVCTAEFLKNSNISAKARPCLSGDQKDSKQEKMEVENLVTHSFLKGRLMEKILKYKSDNTFN